MFRVVVSAVALFAAMLVGFSLLMGVSKMDISVKHDMQRHVVAEPYEAGDVVQVSPDGLRIEALLCKLQLEEDRQTKTVINASYFNVVDMSQARFMDFVDDAKSTFGLPVQADRPNRTNATQLPFEGEVQRVVGAIEREMPNSCFCEVATAVLESRSAACVVEKSLVETELVDEQRIRKTVGVTFRERPIRIENPAALAGICPDLNVDSIPPANQSCGGDSGYSFDVVARGKIGLIREAARNSAH